VTTLVSARDGYFILYPQYFDSRISRGEGRRVPRDMAVRAPTSLDVFHAAQVAGFDPELDPESHHPAFWFHKAGRVLISVDNVDGTKAGLINVIARYMKKR
jgi:signal recognition particle subunit SRP19